MEAWIGEAVGKMHMNGITQMQVAKYLGVTNDYVSLILRGKKKPKDAEKRIMSAIEHLSSDELNSK